MAQSHNLVAAALNKAGITKGSNDTRGVVGRVAGGSASGGGGASGIGASSRISGMDVDRDGPGGGRPGRGRKVSVEIRKRRRWSSPFHCGFEMEEKIASFATRSSALSFSTFISHIIITDDQISLSFPPSSHNH